MAEEQDFAVSGEQHEAELEEPVAEPLQPHEPREKKKPKKEKKPRKPRVTCDRCGRNFAATTRTHKCEPPAGFQREPDRQAATHVPSQSRVPGQSRQLTLDSELSPSQNGGGTPSAAPLSMDDVREFLWGEVKERKKLRAENLAAKIF